MSINDAYNNLKYDINIIETEILKNIKNTILELKPNNIHELFYIYCYMLMKGYFSKDKYYEYNTTGEHFVIDYKIFDEYGIYNGEGVCRHNSIHLNKILNNLAFISNFIGLEVKKIETENIMDFTPNINKNIKSHKDREEYNTYKIEKDNHAAVFIKTKESNFILDPTNLIEIEILKNKKIHCPLGNYVVNQKRLEKTLPEYNYNEYTSINKNNLIEYYKIAREKLLINAKLIENMYNINEENYEEISKKLEYFKL